MWDWYNEKLWNVVSLKERKKHSFHRHEMIRGVKRDLVGLESFAIFILHRHSMRLQFRLTQRLRLKWLQFQLRLYMMTNNKVDIIFTG